MEDPLTRTQQPMGMISVDGEDTSRQMCDMEHELLGSGRWVDVVGDDDVHIEAHTAFVDSEEFKSLPNQGQMMVMGHLSQHLNRRHGQGEGNYA